MANFLSLPEHIAIYIVSLLAKSGFQFLGALIAAGPYGMRLALNEDVLRDASLRLIEDNPTVVNRRSIMRPFFERTIAARNPVAMYLEAIRYVARYGGYTSAIPILSYKWSYLFRKCHPSAAMSFTLSLSMLCVNQTDDAIDVMNRFRAAFSDELEVELVTQRVFNDIIAVSGQRRRRLARLHRKIPSVCYFCNECLWEQSVRHVTLGGGHKNLRTCSWHSRVVVVWIAATVLYFYSAP